MPITGLSLPDCRESWTCDYLVFGWFKRKSANTHEADARPRMDAQSMNPSAHSPRTILTGSTASSTAETPNGNDAAEAQKHARRRERETRAQTNNPLPAIATVTKSKAGST